MNSNELSQAVKDIKLKVDILYDSLVGDLKDNRKPGVLLRLDRAEQSLLLIKRCGWFLFSLILSCAVSIYLKA